MARGRPGCLGTIRCVPAQTYALIRRVISAALVSVFKQYQWRGLCFAWRCKKTGGKPIGCGLPPIHGQLLEKDGNLGMPYISENQRCSKRESEILGFPRGEARPCSSVPRITSQTLFSSKDRSRQDKELLRQRQIPAGCSDRSPEKNVSKILPDRLCASRRAR